MTEKPNVVVIPGDQPVADIVIPEPDVRWQMLRDSMKAQNIDYPELAEKSKIPESTLHKMLTPGTKKRDTRVGTLVPVVKVLGESFDTLFQHMPTRYLGKPKREYDATIIQELRDKVNAQEKIIAEKIESVHELDSQIREYKAWNSALKEKIENLEESIREKNSAAMEARRGIRMSKIANYILTVFIIIAAVCCFFLH